MSRLMATLAAPAPMKAILHVVDLAADDLERVDEPGQGHAGRALLVVVPHRDLALLAQRVEDAEALGLGDVLEVHAAESRLDELDELDELVRVACVSTMSGKPSTPPRYL